MADLTKLKSRRNTLGAPPPAEEASANLQAPELAPRPTAPPTTAPRAGQGAPVRDGRSMRRTGRTVQFATRVSPEFDERLRQIAEREGMLLVEVLEKALDAYEAHRG
jgi:hypothetical protein